MTYEQLLTRMPASALAGDRGAAQHFVDEINSALSGGVSTLTISNKNYLYKLRTKWELRARGKDANWSAHGSKPGRKKKIVSERNVDTTAFGSEDELDPLLASLIRKYGTPKRTDDI